jgi:predicted ester cyclase
MSSDLPAVLLRMLALWNGDEIDPALVYVDECLANGGPGPEEVAAIVAKYRAAFPDLRWNVDDWFVAGNQYVLRMHAAGTHSGGMFSSAVGDATPSERPIVFHGIEVFEVRDDRIVDVWLGWDFGELYVALGAHL